MAYKWFSVCHVYLKNYAFTSEILAKFCYILDCEIDDILIYETSEDFVKQG